MRWTWKCPVRWPLRRSRRCTRRWAWRRMLPRRRQRSLALSAHMAAAPPAVRSCVRTACRSLPAQRMPSRLPPARRVSPPERALRERALQRAPQRAPSERTPPERALEMAAAAVATCLSPRRSRPSSRRKAASTPRFWSTRLASICPASTATATATAGMSWWSRARRCAAPRRAAGCGSRRCRRTSGRRCWALTGRCCRRACRRCARACSARVSCRVYARPCGSCCWDRRLRTRAPLRRAFAATLRRRSTRGCALSGRPSRQTRRHALTSGATAARASTRTCGAPTAGWRFSRRSAGPTCARCGACCFRTPCTTSTWGTARA
mmetsp:Transcript_26007/g.77102  ORF Transcript_26007/g.77102 Transcript_26007/m.77102 type:complete len:322 (-) Transcript_26007:3375-4340(-)